jgi:hypothetical protein
VTDPADHTRRLKKEQRMVEIKMARNQLAGFAELIRVIKAGKLVVSGVKPGPRYEEYGSQQTAP